MRKKVLITGGSGLLAVNWALSIRDRFSVILILHDRKISIPGVDLEVSSLDSIEDCNYAIEKHRPNLVINCAALTNVENCEQFSEKAKKVNVELAKNIAVACNALNIKLVHISTDHLSSGLYPMSSEDDIVNPVNNYAHTKYMGELEVIKSSKNALIVRTNFFGWGTKYRQSFSDFILNQLRANKTVDLFQDVFFTTILIDELVRSVEQLINLNASGIFNVVSKERLTKFEFGLKLAACFKLNPGLINPIYKSSKLELTNRPMDMSLSTLKLTKTLKCDVASIDEQLQHLKLQEESDNHTLSQVTLDIIPYGKHYVDEADIKAVSDVLRSGMLTQAQKF